MLTRHNPNSAYGETQPVPEFKVLKRNTFRPTVLLSFDASSVYKTIALPAQSRQSKRNKAFGNTKEELTCGMPHIRIE